MEIKIECPRCQTFMTLSGDKGGQYTSCSNCGGKVWVPKQAVRPAQSAAAVATPVKQAATKGAATSATGTQQAAPPAGNGGAAAQARPVQQPAAARQPAPGKTPAPAAKPTQPTPPPPQAPPPQPTGAPASQPQRKVAKFITADVANSSLALAGDGQLPELQLDQSDDKKKREPAEKQGSRPWLLALVVCASVSVSVLLLMAPTPGVQKGNTQVEQARQRIQEAYFGKPTETLAPYQIMLREAHLAHSRGDVKAEEASYRRVLALLRDESLLRPDGSPRNQKGLTGTRLKSGDASTLPSDEDLQEQISIILRDLD